MGEESEVRREGPSDDRGSGGVGCLFVCVVYVWCVCVEVVSCGHVCT